MVRPLSIALRLGLLFACIATVVFLAVGEYLYQTLAGQMGARDDAELLNKAVLMRQLLHTMPQQDRMSPHMEELLGRVIGQDGVGLQVVTASGWVLVGPALPDPGAMAAAVPLGREPVLADVVGREEADGTKRVLSVLAEGDTSPLVVTLVRMRSDRVAILRHYAADLLGALIAGTCTAIGLGFLAVRRGLRPLYGMIGRADAINARRLTTRMPVAGLPAELRALSIAFNAMLDRLEDGVQRLSGFAADLAHDMRTPVNALMMQTQVALSRERTAEEYQALLASNLEEYERLARMVENTLFLARADNAQLALRGHVLDVQAELEHIREYFEMLAEDKDIVLAHDMAPGLTLHADPVLLRRAVNNLVSNAITHTPPGGAISMAACRDGHWITLTVANSGAGIAPVHLPHIFDRYYSTDQARAHCGSGLGLAIVRAIMQLHGGKAEVESVPGQRTVFSLRFPCDVRG
jgi:two-component system heavy metal sensor histidine kinase CusS